MTATAANSPGRIVLLGRQGFVARHCLARLQAAALPHLALGRPELELTAPDAAPALAALVRPDDRLIFLAALTPEHGRDAATLARNLAMAATVAAALARQPCAHLTYVSSDAVYGDTPGLVSESNPLAPADLYGLMHLAREQVLASLPVPLIVARPTAIYGLGDTHDGYGPNRFARALARDEPIQLFGQGEERRDHVDVADVAAALLALTTGGLTGVVNLISGSSPSFFDLAQSLQHAAASDRAITFLPRRQPVRHRFYDPTRLHRLLPAHRPTPWTLGVPHLLSPATSA